jgi:hypothetical protein
LGAASVADAVGGSPSSGGWSSDALLGSRDDVSDGLATVSRRFDLERLVKRKAPFAVRRVVNPYFDLERFFNDALRYQWKMRDEPAMESTWGAYYEFGVGPMTSMLAYGRACNRTQKLFGFEHPRIFGFDTFTGLPETDHPSDVLEGWSPGRYALSVAECKALAQREGIRNVEFVKGLFSESLTDDLLRRLQAFPPGIVNIDVDFYTSTVEVLEFLGPLMTPGLLFHFDDVWSFNGDPTRGELRAINEFNHRGPYYLTPHWLGLGSGNVYAVSKPLTQAELEQAETPGHERVSSS